MLLFRGDFAVECFDAFGDCFLLSAALFFFAEKFVESSTTVLHCFVTIAEVAHTRRRHRIAETKLIQCCRPGTFCVPEFITGLFGPLLGSVVRLYR